VCLPQPRDEKSDDRLEQREEGLPGAARAEGVFEEFAHLFFVRVCVCTCMCVSVGGE
jgi:hypothetical protein